MQWGRWGKMPAVDRQCADAVADGDRLLGGGGRAVGGLRPQRIVTRQLLDAVGASFAINRVQWLNGMSHGHKRSLGMCWHDGKVVTWEWWFPHMGIAVDCAMPAGGEAECQAKLAWAQAEGRYVAYFAPDTPLETIAAVAASRRAVPQQDVEAKVG